MDIAMLIPIIIYIAAFNIVILLSEPVPEWKPAACYHFTPVVIIVLVKVVIKVLIMHIFDHNIICCLLGGDCVRLIWESMGFSFSFMGFSFNFSDL